MANVIPAQDGLLSFHWTRSAIADLFTMTCALALLMTGGYLWLSESPLEVNINIVATGTLAFMMAWIALFKVRFEPLWAGVFAALVTGIFLLITRTSLDLDAEILLILALGSAFGGAVYYVALTQYEFSISTATFYGIGGALVGMLLVTILLGRGIGFNLDLLLKLGVGVLFGMGLTRDNVSRYMSWAVALLGLNGILYYMDVYTQACVFTRSMTLIFWVSALTTGGLLAQGIVPRGNDDERPMPKATAVNEEGKRVRIRTRIATGSIVLYTVMTVLAFIAMVPFLWMISTSFMTLGETLNRTWVPGELQVCNYYEAWQTARFNIYFGNSIVIAIVSITGLLTVSILAAYAFAKIQFFGRNLIFTLLLATLMVPEIVVMIPNYLVVSGNVFAIPVTTGAFPFLEFGMSGAGDAAIFSWIDELSVLTIPFMGSAFSIFLLRQFFVQIPHELWEAARIDGAGHLRFLIQVVIPISRPPILTVSLLAFIGSWNSLLWPLLVTTDPEKWRPIAYGLQAFSTEAGQELHLLTAGAFITILPMLLLYFLTQKSFTEGIATTGLKG